MAKNKNLPAHLQEKYSRGDDRLTLYERHEKPIACRSRPSLSNPRSTNDIVRAVLRANPTLLRSATNRDPTEYKEKENSKYIGIHIVLKNYKCSKLLFLNILRCNYLLTKTNKNKIMSCFNIF